jgi:hypothetical protein
MTASDEPCLPGDAVFLRQTQFQTARRARAEGAKLILAARNPERLEHVSRELAL